MFENIVLRSGRYRVRNADGTATDEVCELWRGQSFPPTAQKGQYYQLEK